jgi:hypothetical protein
MGRPFATIESAVAKLTVTVALPALPNVAARFEAARFVESVRSADGFGTRQGAGR